MDSARRCGRAGRDHGRSLRPAKAVAAVLLAGLAACSGGPPDLNHAAAAVGAMVAPAHLKRSMFYAEYPNGTPSQYVSFLFSQMGSAEWPPAAGELDADLMRVSGMRPLPAGVAFVPRRPDPSRGRQLVVLFNDERGVVIAEAYVDPAQEPVFRREWSLPKVEPDPIAKQVHRVNREHGLTSESF